MIKIGLTGNFHSGHKEIVQHFCKSGTPVFDADILLKYLINFDKKTKHEIKEKFGPNTYVFGSLNFMKFDTNKKYEKILKLLTPKIFEIYQNFRQRHINYPYTIFLSSILFENKWDSYMNYNINVYKPSMLRKKTILTETNIDVNMVEYILENEMNELVKNSKSNFVIHNYGANNIDFKVINEIHQIHSNIIRHCKNLDYEKTF